MNEKIQQALKNFRFQAKQLRRALGRLEMAVSAMALGPKDQLPDAGEGIVEESECVRFAARGLEAERQAFILTCEGVTPKLVVSIELEPDYESPEDLCDAESVKWVQEQMRRGNEWAWCCARVAVRFGDGRFGIETDAYLGGCSFLSEHDFQTAGYYADMVRECADEIEANIGSIFVDELWKQVKEHLAPFEAEDARDRYKEG